MMTYPQFFLEKYVLIVKPGHSGYPIFSGQVINNCIVCMWTKIHASTFHFSDMLPVACSTKQGR